MYDVIASVQEDKRVAHIALVVHDSAVQANTAPTEQTCPTVEPYSVPVLYTCLPLTQRSLNVPVLFPVQVQDATAAIQRAVDFAYRNYLVVHFPLGRYVVTDTIVCKCLWCRYCGQGLLPVRMLVSDATGQSAIDSAGADNGNAVPVSHTSTDFGTMQVHSATHSEASARSRTCSAVTDPVTRTIVPRWCARLCLTD